MTDKERHEIQKRLEANRAKRAAAARALAADLAALPSDVPIANGPRNQKEYLAMQRDIEKAAAEDEETSE